MREPRWFYPVAVPDGVIVVRALNRAQFDLWVREQPPGLPGQRRYVFAERPQSFEGLRPSAIVHLPSWERHPQVPAVDCTLQRVLAMRGRSVPRIFVREAR